MPIFLRLKTKSRQLGSRTVIEVWYLETKEPR